MANNETYADIKNRLDEIVEAVSDENIALDDALKLYEEAVALGSKVSEAIESDILPDTDSESNPANDQTDTQVTSEA